jgi:hypothetical protein
MSLRRIVAVAALASAGVLVLVAVARVRLKAHHGADQPGRVGVEDAGGQVGQGGTEPGAVPCSTSRPCSGAAQHGPGPAAGGVRLREQAQGWGLLGQYDTIPFLIDQARRALLGLVRERFGLDTSEATAPIGWAAPRVLATVRLPRPSELGTESAENQVD